MWYHNIILINMTIIWTLIYISMHASNMLYAMLYELSNNNIFNYKLVDVVVFLYR